MCKNSLQTVIRGTLVLDNSFHRASAGAGAAAYALVCVDFVDGFALSDCFDGAFTCARAAANALIGNFVCHDMTPLLLRCT